MTLALSAVLVAAGRSTRMGQEKALLDVNGTPLWRHQRDTLVQAGAGEIFLSARPEQSWVNKADGFASVVHDAIRDGGPLLGVTAALERAANPWVAALAVDLPKMPAQWFKEMYAVCLPGVGVVGRRGGYFEPLAAIYPREMRFLAWEAIARGEFSFQAVLATAVAKGILRVREATASESPWFENWNEPADAKV